MKRLGLAVAASVVLMSAARPVRASDDWVTVYVPPFEGPASLSTGVATILDLQIWQGLRSVNAAGESLGRGIVVWGRPLAGFGHEAAEARAKESNLLAQLVFWGKVYEYGGGAIAQTHLSIPNYRRLQQGTFGDFREHHPESWTITIAGPQNAVSFEADLPRRRYSFEPIVLSQDVIRRYSRPGALSLYPTRTSVVPNGTLGDEFTALEHGDQVARVSSGGVKGWIHLPELSKNRSEVVDFVGGLIYIFRGDWQQAEKFMNRVIDTARAPDELRTDAYLYKGMALARQKRLCSGPIAEALRRNPDARRCIVYAVMGKLSDSLLVAPEQRMTLLEDARRLLRENSYLFEPEDQFVSRTLAGVETLIGAKR
jgi:hypothetical protein